MTANVAAPRGIVWQLTYACPLRCVHCYTESGRRPTRQLSRPEQSRVVDAMISLEPYEISLGGGEPLIVPGVYELAEQIRAADVGVSVWTSGWTIGPDLIDPILDSFDAIHVSVDGATAEMHDAIRGRRGSFDRATRALELLGAGIDDRRRRGQWVPYLGIDCCVTRSNFGQLRQYCGELLHRFPEVTVANLDACLPNGLASRAGFAEHELLTEQLCAELTSDELGAELRSLAPRGVTLGLDAYQAWRPSADNLQPETGFMEVEADGSVRVYPFLEWTAGSLLTESAAEVWARVHEYRRDPFLAEVFASVTDMTGWAVAVRRLDEHFGSGETQQRIARRPEFIALPAVPAPAADRHLKEKV
ncbi:hypothetical protein GCM10009554_18960 [Kribbella koreensis]|uniref:Radical SAM core domain-containing protein n=2 Tax=Kribbella TaxID=182639 RepID=A0ABP6Y4V3_9ACTN